jgi:hypothetical protein
VSYGAVIRIQVLIPSRGITYSKGFIRTRLVIAIIHNHPFPSLISLHLVNLNPFLTLAQKDEKKGDEY